MNEFITRKVVDAQIAVNEKAADETGATAIEYAVMAAAIAAVVVVAARALGTDVTAVFDRVGNAINP